MSSNVNLKELANFAVYAKELTEAVLEGDDATAENLANYLNSEERFGEVLDFIETANNPVWVPGDTHFH